MVRSQSYTDAERLGFLKAEPERIHREYARARKEFRQALRDVLGLHERCTGEQLERECERVLELLQ